VLFVVATPIGNLKDITLRALEALRECDAIVAEDTRHTRKLLSAHGIEGKPLLSLHARSTERDVERVAERLRAGERVALVTDAGTPGVSDPGDALVRAAIAAGVRVVPIPGPSAVLAALSASGLGGGGAFRFAGFLPREGTARARAVATVAGTPEPVVLFESPERAKDTLAELAAIAPARPACVARELTKVHEELARGTLAELARSGPFRGEIVIVLGAQPVVEEPVDDASIDARIDEELARGSGAKRTAELVAAWSGRPRREIYARVVRRAR
jgi:16S rRNA (cytidine1402-2'-O)-methyltransferase